MIGCEFEIIAKLILKQFAPASASQAADAFAPGQSSPGAAQRSGSPVKIIMSYNAGEYVSVSHQVDTAAHFELLLTVVLRICRLAFIHDNRTAAVARVRNRL